MTFEQKPQKDEEGYVVFHGFVLIMGNAYKSQFLSVVLAKLNTNL